MASEDDSAPGTQVGYGNPPVHSRFRKGQSGNPGGRPKRKHFSGIGADPRTLKLLLAQLGQ